MSAVISFGKAFPSKKTPRCRQIGHGVPPRLRATKIATGHGDHADSDGSQHAVEAFWKNLVRKNFELLRGSWSILELLVGIPWLARERQRQKRLYERQYAREEVCGGFDTDRKDLLHAKECLKLATSMYSVHVADGIERFLDETHIRAADVHFVQHTSTFADGCPSGLVSPVPGHVIATSNELRAVVFLVRGTEVRDKSGRSWLPVDVLADLAAFSEPFLGGHAHLGMVLAAKQLFAMHREVCPCLHSPNQDPHVPFMTV